MDIVGLLITLAIGAAAGWLAGTLVEGAGFRLALEHPDRHRRCLCGRVAISEIGSWFNPGRRHCRRYRLGNLGGGGPASGGQSNTTARQLSVGAIRPGTKTSAGVPFVASTAALGAHMRNRLGCTQPPGHPTGASASAGALFCLTDQPRLIQVAPTNDGDGVPRNRPSGLMTPRSSRGVYLVSCERRLSHPGLTQHLRRAMACDKIAQWTFTSNSSATR